jgi:uncharacterized protein with von Willebrand factor type A (vWA) domain
MAEEERPLPFLVGFARALRASRLVVGAGQVVRFARAVARLDPGDPLDLYWAGRACLLSRREDLPSYEREFRAYFLDEGEGGRVVVSSALPLPSDRVAALMAKDGSRALPGRESARERSIGTAASSLELLRHKDFSVWTPQELQALHELMRELALGAFLRRTRRTRPDPRGRLPDLRRTLRSSLRTQGELVRRSWRKRRLRPRRLVLFLDVSGSMADYSRALLQFAHAVARGVQQVEVFCFGTRLTRLTDALRRRDPALALDTATATVLDWDGGTRIGDSLRDFNRAWGWRNVVRGAIVVVCSDGLERGDPNVLASQMARLSRFAHRIVWVNRLKGDTRYQPLAGGMQPALPFVDLLVPGHNLASLEALASLLPRLERSRALAPRASATG